MRGGGESILFTTANTLETELSMAKIPNSLGEMMFNR